MYRFRIDRLREAAAAKGDTSGYAIARRTDIAESSVYRLLAGASQPDLITALRLGEAYEISVESLMERTDVDAASVAGVA
ncbi:XRE family transcriptional regulator [Streptomyces sp. NPDC012950]|uniref:XRE family transcriptional regulator n=1 Tax=Streptomyces sp. NPDC012950 TaxID=3364858 RepID=UPI00368E3C07